MSVFDASSRSILTVKQWDRKAQKTFHDPIAINFWRACVDELTALKPGNVHCYASGHDMTIEQFLESAYVASPIMARQELTLGARILKSVQATKNAVSVNTNLGIILLCAPLAQAILCKPSCSLRQSVTDVISQSGISDARQILQAIQLASPSGLGKSELHDVFSPASVGIIEIMAVAESSDMIARQYANGFAEIFGFGSQVMQQAQGSHNQVVTQIYLNFLSTYPDSHIIRQHGKAVAEEIRSLAYRLLLKLNTENLDRNLYSELLICDKVMKRREINPGTSADLTVATLFANYISNRIN